MRGQLDSEFVKCYASGMFPSPRWASVAAILLALAVGFGAFGAHALRGKLDPYGASIYEKAVFYHFVHALGLLVVAGMASLSGGARGIVSSLLTGGILLFSGSLYLLALTGQRWFGAITPAGGVSFILAWLWLAVSLLRNL